MPRAALLLVLVLAAAAVPASARAAAPALHDLHVTNGSTPFLGDGPLDSPNGDGFRDAAFVRFRLAAPARVSFAVVHLWARLAAP